MALIPKRNFSAGEISPDLHAHVDLTKYQTGLKTCRNFLVTKKGGVQNRPGTGFIGEVKDSTKSVRLIPFIFSDDQSYVLEFGHLYMRVIKNGAHILVNGKNITSITNSAQCTVTTSGAHVFNNGDEVKFTLNVANGVYELNGRTFKVSDVTGTTFKIKYMDGSTYVDSSAFSAYVSGGQVEEVYTITTIFEDQDLFNLKYVQSNDIILLAAGRDLAIQELTRSSDSSWAITDMDPNPGINGLSGLGQSHTAGGFNTIYAVTAVDPVTLQESTLTAVTVDTHDNVNPITISWTPIGNYFYNIYRSQMLSVVPDAPFGFIYSTANGESSYVDNFSGGDFEITADFLDTPPLDAGTYSLPEKSSAIGLYQQRLILGNYQNSGDEDPALFHVGRSGYFTNFTSNIPLKNESAFQFRLFGKKYVEIRHIIDLGKLVIFTSTGEWVAEGGQDGILTPTAINLKQHSYYGASNLEPIIIDSSVLFVQERGGSVRDLGFDYQVDGYRGNDLSIFSHHLLEGHELVDWTYQQIPNSIVWAVRDDGVLIGMTYVREQQIIAWHRHDFDGEVESVCSIPEGEEDFLYLSIKRTIDGDTKRYVERLNTRLIDDVKDAVFVDCALTYDGRNTSAITMILSLHGVNWTADDLLSLASSASYFTAASVGNEVHLTGADGEVIRISITEYLNSTTVRGYSNRTVPASLRVTATVTWAYAVDSLSGLWHLEGKEVSIFADGNVIANPNNPAYETVYTVTNGAITLPQCYGVIHVGLPYVSDIKTLAIDVADGNSIAHRKQISNRIISHVVDSRGFWAGNEEPDSDDSLENLVELKIRDQESYDEPVALTTDKVDIIIQSNWNSDGSVFIRQTDPVPLHITSVMPDDLIQEASSRKRS